LLLVTTSNYAEKTSVPPSRCSVCLALCEDQITQRYAIDLHAFGRAGSKLLEAGYPWRGILQIKNRNLETNTKYCDASAKKLLYMVARHNKVLLARVSERGFFVATLSHIREFPCDRALEQHCAHVRTPLLVAAAMSPKSDRK
jgi:hypothetical protein